MRPSARPPAAGLRTDEVAALLSPYHPQLPAKALDQLQTYLGLLLKWNRQMSLSAIKDPRRMVTDLFGESLYLATILQTVPLRGSIVDVGAGAGFPGLAMKLVASEVPVTLVESNGRKCAFLKEVTGACGFTGVEVVADRFKSWVGSGGRADLAVSRAVRVDNGFLGLLRSCLHDKGGLALCTTTDVVVQVQSSVLRGEKLQTFDVPHSSDRTILVLRK